VSEAPALTLLDRLAATHERVARGIFRYACGLPASPAGAAVAQWLAAHGADAAPVIDPDPRNATTAAIDLSVETDTVADPTGVTGTSTLSALVVDLMDRAGATVGVGRYDEARCLYTSDVFARAPGDRHERRTVHIGVDLFLPAGTPVHAPFDGVVRTVRDNAGHLDYGPTVVLDHAPPDGPPFSTLYGHLSRDVLTSLAPGDRIARGAAFAAFGTFEENGNWPPHLHFQVIADLLDTVGDFPGVAAPSERDVWCSICPNPTAMLHLPDDTRAPRPDALALLERRQRTIVPALSLHYRAPLHIVRGRGATLYDAEGRAYLDLVNNIAHVGHANPAVVAALARQAAVLNTNTRYLHDTMLRYAERLTALLPDPLTVCVFVNSGSEANDLALRMARAATGGTGVVVLDSAYHGHTAALIDASPYKFAGPGGEGRRTHVRVVPTPDTYRGRHRDRTDAGTAYAAYVGEACADLHAAGTPPAAFMAESLVSCGGQIDPPPGYLEAAFAHARDAAALTIADEVQVGFGRVGSHWWGFETQGARPDIVTVGKPAGNGHPLGAVVTTPAIAETFANGMEYFNSFGGNPVSCAVGLAVLDAIETDDLRGHADRVGMRALERLRAVAARRPLIGDVRGRGLFLGVELVRDPETRSPARAEAAWVVERLRERGILLSTDGPDDNVLKIKPPMVVDDDAFERFAGELDAVLALLD
jgi:4-aminobutyrate aminotransferase-like enzyme